MTDTPEVSSEGEKAAEREGILASLRAEHRFVKWWELDGHGLIVCRRLTRTEMLTFAKAGTAADKKHDASGDITDLVNLNETILKTTCVWPKDRSRLQAVFDEYPHWAGPAASAIGELGRSAGITEGKD